MLVLFVNIGIPNGYRPVNHIKLWLTGWSRFFEISTSDWSNLNAWIDIAPFAFPSACAVRYSYRWIFQLESFWTAKNKVKIEVEWSRNGVKWGQIPKTASRSRKESIAFRLFHFVFLIIQRGTHFCSASISSLHFKWYSIAWN